MNSLTNSPGATAPAAAPWWGRISLLWLMFAPLCVTLYTLFLGIAPNDFWYHARAGMEIVTTGRIPTVALFTAPSAWVPENTPYFYQSWISDVIYYLVLKWWGLGGIIIVRSLCMLVAFVLLTKTVRQRCRALVHQRYPDPTEAAARLELLDSPLARIAALSTLATLGLAASNMDARPQMFSVPLFTLFLAALFAWPEWLPAQRRRALLCLPLAMAVWANTHGAFFTGLILLTVAFGAETVFGWLVSRRTTPSRWGSSLPREAQWGLGLLVLACTLTAMINQRGAGIYRYVYELARNETGQKYIQEWKAPTLDEWYSVLFFASLVLLVATIGWRLRQAPKAIAMRYGHFGVRPAEWAILAALTAMSLRDIRSIIWYGFLFAPIFAAVCTSILLHRKANAAKVDSTTVQPGMYAVNAGLAGLLALMVVPTLPPFKALLPMPKEYTKQFAPTPREAFPRGFSGTPPWTLERETPVEAAQFLLRNPPRGKLFNDMVFGSYLTWALYPQILGSSDPRVELFPTAFWEEYGVLTEGPPGIAKTLRDMGYTDALLHKKRQKKMIGPLQSAGWKVVFQAGPSIVLRAPMNSSSRANG